MNNPTAYYVTIVDAASSPTGEAPEGFEPLMLEPRGNAPLKVPAATLGASPVLTYINDYGGRPQLRFDCNGGTCKATPVEPQG